MNCAPDSALDHASGEAVEGPANTLTEEPAACGPVTSQVLMPLGPTLNVVVRNPSAEVPPGTLTPCTSKHWTLTMVAAAPCTTCTSVTGAEGAAEGAAVVDGAAVADGAADVEGAAVGLAVGLAEGCAVVGEAEVTGTTDPAPLHGTVHLLAEHTALALQQGMAAVQ